MTTAHPADRPGRRAASVPAAPLTRLLRAELSLVLHRPRTLVSLAVLALVPVAIGIGLAAHRSRDASGPTGHWPGPGLIAAATGNGLLLPVASLAVTLALLLPLTVCLTAADALAGERASGTLRGLLLAPVGRLRLVGIKAFGVLAVTVLAVLLVTVLGTVVGTVLVGNGAGLLTLSGSLVGPGPALGRVGLAAGWTCVQLAAVGAVALGVSALTARPLVVLACVLGGAIVSGVLGAIPTLDWLRPWLLPSAWPALADLLRDPVPTDALHRGALVATGYLVVGLAVAVADTLYREA